MALISKMKKTLTKIYNHQGVPTAWTPLTTTNNPCIALDLAAQFKL